MIFNANTVMDDMAEAVRKTAADEVGIFNGYAKMVMDKEKEALEELAQARLFGDISDEEFLDEVERGSYRHAL